MLNPNPQAAPHEDDTKDTNAAADERVALIRPDDFAAAINHIYGGAPLEGYIPLFAMRDEGDGYRFPIKWFDSRDGLASVILYAQQLAAQLAAEEQGGQDAPLSHVAICGCTFGDLKNEKGSRTASETNIIQCRAVCIDHDLNPYASVAKLRDMVAPTFSTHSGGFHGVLQKRHDWIVFDAPLTAKDAHAKLKDAVRRVIKWCGAGDAALSNLVHPLRCPGSLHRKPSTGFKPSASMIVEDGKARCSVDELTKSIDRVAPPEKQRRKSAREKEDGRITWRENIRNGEQLHDSLNRLAMSLVADGRSYAEIEVELESLMYDSIRQQTDHASWQERFNDIPRIVETALSKVENSDSFAAQEDRREKVALMRDAAKVAALKVDVESRIEKLSPADAGNDRLLEAIINDIGLLRLDDLIQRLRAEAIASKLRKTKLASHFATAIMSATIRARSMWIKANLPAQDEAVSTVPLIDLSSLDINPATEAAWAALAHDADTQISDGKNPRVFNTPTGLARVIKNEQTGQPSIEGLDGPKLQNEVRQVSNWLPRSGNPPYILPSKDIVAMMLGTPEASVPWLFGIDDVPRFGADGSLSLRPGYNPLTRRVYYPRLSIPDVNLKPSKNEALAARDLLLWLALEGFPFIDDESSEQLVEIAERVAGGELAPWDGRALCGKCSRANMLAMILEPFVRAMITGCTPLYAVRKNLRKVGSGYLLHLAAMTAFGRVPDLSAKPNSEDEMRKLITAKVAEMALMFFLDNFEGSLESVALSAALTGDSWTDRELGHSRMITGATNFLYAVTGNNYQLGADFISRAVLIRMHSDDPDPQQRTDFRIKQDFKTWVAAEQCQLIHAALTIIQYWIALGAARDSSLVFGAFENYAAVMGGILASVDVEGFLGNRHVLQQASINSEGDAMVQLYRAWVEHYGAAPVLVGTPQKDYSELDTRLFPHLDGILGLIAKYQLDFGAEIDVGKYSLASVRAALGKRALTWEGWPICIDGKQVVKLVIDRDKHVKRNKYRLVISEKKSM